MRESPNSKQYPAEIAPWDVMGLAGQPAGKGTILRIRCKDFLDGETCLRRRKYESCGDGCQYSILIDCAPYRYEQHLCRSVGMRLEITTTAERVQGNDNTQSSG